MKNFLPTNSLVAKSISFGCANSAAISSTTTPAQIITDVRAGKWRRKISALRAATGEQRDKLKKQLPAILWSGTFSTRRNSGLQTYSGLLCADLDDCGDRVSELHDLARLDPHVAAAFVSPSGTGLKIVFAVQPDASRHAANFAAVRAHVATRYKAEVDEAAKDVARLCFVSHDPAAFFNPNVQPLESNGVLNASNGTPQGQRNNAAFELACECRDAGKSVGEAESEILEFAAKCNPPLPAAEALNCVKSAFRQPPKFLETPLPPIVDAADFLAQPMAMPPELIAGLVHQGSKLALGGNSKAFKTWLLLHMAVAVATGADWLGFPTNKGKVLFCNFEIQDAPWQRRIAAVTRALNVELEAGDVSLLNLRGFAADYRSLIPKIIARTKSEGFALVILDPLYKCLGVADENSARDVAGLLNGIEALATQTGAAVAYANHFAKGNAAGKLAQDRISGSGVFSRDPDTLIVFTAHETEGSFSVETILRNFKPVNSFCVTWNFPLMVRDNQLDPADLKKAIGRTRQHTEQHLLDVLGNKSLTTTEWQTGAEAEHGISRRTFYGLKKTLEQSGRVLKSKIDDKWQRSNSK